MSADKLIDRIRPEGVYCTWKTEPPEGGTFSVRLLTIERVNGDDTVDVLGCTTDEAQVILASIQEEAARPKTGAEEYEELKATGMSDYDIRMLRNAGASHKAILLLAKQRAERRAKAEPPK